MTKLAIRTHLMRVATGLLVLGAAACPDSQYATSAYCDDSGCYSCDEHKRCWPVSNSKCTSDASCAAGSLCTSIGCARACASSGDCGEESCVSGFCAPAGFTEVHRFSPPLACQDDSGCATGELCEAGKCVPRCQSDDDCGPDSVCAPCGKCQPKGLPASCGDAQVFCSETVGCGSGKACLQSRCHLQCQNSSSCPVGQICSAGLCQDDPSPAQPACLLNSQCGGGVCVNGYCHDACLTSVQCGSGALCQMGICQPDYTPAR